MPSILVVEPELDSAHRIRDLLTPLGMQVRIASGPGQAFEASAAEAPDLVLVSSEVAGAGSIANTFSRRSGGPGVIAVLAATPLARFFAAEGDDQVTKPFSDQDLLQAVERALAANPAAPAAPKKMALSPDMKLTSQDIFGDVLAEVESAIPTLPAPPRHPQPQMPRSPVASRTAPGTPADDEMKRKLEKTLSGVLGPEFLSRPTPSPRKPEPPDDVDALISKTLSNLDMGARSRPAAPAPASPQPPSPPAATPQAPAPRPQTKTDIDFAEIAGLARTGRRSEPAPGAPPSPPSPPPPRVEPPPAAPAAAAAPAPPPASVQPPPPAPMATQRIEMSGLLFEDDGEGGEQFGQYRLLEKIAVGGMAELWKARMRGVQGFQKTVAIKKILPHMTDNADFVEMFIDEAKLAAQLNHPNIVHIYDLGKMGRDYYIAMEFVEGKDLRSLLNRAAKNGQSVPVPLALLIAARLASALHYAHRKRDFEGREMGLVHRDVSPQNVLLTLDGDVKLCDFGIAKAVSKVGQTQVGALKGKLQYMSPEQAWGKAVDFRSDIFSLGTILFELLTGERLFPGDSEMSILEAVRQNRIRSPRDVVPSILPEVDEIVGKALATQPEDRYASAGEMEHRIEALLHELRLTPGSADLANFIQDVITSQPRDDRSRRPATPAAPPVAAAASWPVTPPTVAPPPEPMPVPSTFDEPPPVEAAPAVAAVTAPYPPRETTVVPIAPLGELPPQEKRGKGWLVIVLLVLAIALAAAYFLFVKPRTATAPAVAPAAAPAAGKATSPPSAAAAGTSPAPQAAVPEAMIQGQVEEALAKQQQELQREFEEKKRQLEREIARNKAAAKSKPQSPPDPPSPPSR